LGDLAVKRTEFIELKELYLEGQERQKKLENQLSNTTEALRLMQEIVVTLIREVQVLHEDQDGDDEVLALPPDFVLKNGSHLEIN
jgi:hypothetical protein